MSAAAAADRRPNPVLLAIALACSLFLGLLLLVVVAVALVLADSDWLQLPSERGTRVFSLWWLVATLCEWVLLAAPLAWMQRGGVRIVAQGWDVRPWPLILLTAALLGALESVALGWGLGAAAVLYVVGVWRLALIPGRSSWRPRDARGRLALVGLALALASVSATYAVLHPVNATFEGRTDYDGSLMWHARTSPQSFELTLENESDQAVTLRSLRVPGLETGTHVRVRGGLVHGSYSDTRVDPLGALAGVALGEEPLLVRIRLTRAACAARSTSWRFERVEARFETLGLTRTQRFAVDPPGRLRCG